MDRSGTNGGGGRPKAIAGISEQLPLDHYARVLLHRWWIILTALVVVSGATIVFTSRMPDIYSSETVIMVDPQKVPDTYVKPTVTGDIRNRLGTLSQQILSATRLQKIIDTLNLYPEDKKTLAREDLINRMRQDISVRVVSEFSSTQDMQAFRIAYSGREPRLVAQVTNELASLFIEENLRAREQQATGTTEFLQNQLQETRKTLEQHEARLKDFKLKHIGEMPEHQAASLQIVGQLQSQLQLASEALNRAEQQKSYIQSMMATQGAAPVVDLDEGETKPAARTSPAPAVTQRSGTKAKLEALLRRYSEDHPDVKRLRRQLADEEAKAAVEPVVSAAAPEPAEDATPAPRTSTRPALPAVRYNNPVLESQLRAIEAEIVKQKQEQQRLSAMVSRYQNRLEAIPVREQEITELVRDYEISKAHYKQLLEKQLSAETATQLEIRQKGERFSVLDPAQPAERPSRPNRLLLNLGGTAAGLVLGLLLALVTEFLGISITSPEQITAATALPVLEVIPVIWTHSDRVVRKRRLVLAAASTAVIGIFGFAALLYRYRDRIF